MKRRNGLATRLYRGEAGLNIVGRRKVWFSVAGTLILVAILSFGILRFDLGIEFEGGNEFQLPQRVGTLQEAESAVNNAFGQLSGAEEGHVVSTQKVGGGNGTYLVRTTQLDATQANQVREAVAEELDIPASAISESRVSPAWGAQVSQRALLGLVVFVILVLVYLVLRFEWRMAVAAVSSLLLDLIITAGIYSLIGFEVTPSTIIGFLTILGFALYDVVVVFDKVQENARGITASSTQTYAEAANLAVNQTLMRSINTGLVALLPVGGLLFIGAGLLGAGTLKDLGLVLFFGMGIAVYSSIFFATPVLVTLKEHDPRIQAHTKRVLARRGAAAQGETTPKASRPAQSGVTPAAATAAAVSVEPKTLAASAPKVGARPAGKRSGGGRGGRSGGGNRPGGKRR